MTTKKDPQTIVISPPRFSRGTFLIEGISPYVGNRFAAKGDLMATQKAGSQARTKKKRSPKDFNALYENAKHLSPEGWCGMPAPAFRNGMISACRLVGFKMTLAKLSVFIHEDGYDQDGLGIVRITNGRPKQVEHPVRNANGSIDIRSRPMWAPGWQAKVLIEWDEDQFSLTDVTNLLSRVGRQVGIGEGRPDSKDSPGVGWGRFKVVSVS